MIMNVNMGVKAVIQAEMGMEVGEAVGIKYGPLSALRFNHISKATISSLMHFCARFK